MFPPKNINLLDPKQLFLIDALGALVSALMLGFILTTFESYFGMPNRTLYWLAGLAFIFFIYSILCYFIFPEDWRLYMKVIAIINLSYCGLTLILMIYWNARLTGLGLTYFVLEMGIIILLSTLELKTSYSRDI